MTEFWIGFTSGVGATVVVEGLIIITWLVIALEQSK